MAATTANYGTLQISDLLRVNNTSIIDFGVMDVFEAIRMYLAAYNVLLGEQLGLLVERTTERVVGTAGPVTMVAIDTDEMGVADSQKVAGPTMMGFPLRKWDVTLQWTEQWFLNHTPQEIAVQAQAATIADLQKLQLRMRQAIFTPTNRTSTDRLRDNMAIPVKPFANADGFPIPPAPNGFIFNASTHNHYMGTTGGTSGSALASADLDALLNNVLEHYNGGVLYLYVSQDVEAAMNAGRYATPSTFPQYAPLVYTQQVAPITSIFTAGALQEAQPFNRFAGTYRDAKVFVKPWMPLGTLFAFMSGQRKPVAMRVRASLDSTGRFTEMAGGDNGDFRMVFESISHPLHCQMWSRECGFGVQDRIGGAVMTVGSTTYTMPNLTPGSSAYMV